MPNEIKTMHIELTSLCNAKCPQCARTDNPNLPKEYISLDDIKQWFSPDFVKNLVHIYSCGNYGDPAASPDCLKIYKWFLDNGCKRLSLYSNGGLKNTSFWKELAELNVRVVFAIDGLEDTNHIYRVNVKWAKLMENVKAFIKAGGHAEWDYLTFSHNEHQVEDAKVLAQHLGFKKFSQKISSRLKKDKKKITEENNIKPSSIAKKIHLDPLNQLKKEYKTIDNYFEKTEIFCKTRKEGSLYIDFQGKVWPCCWMGHRFNKSPKPRSDSNELFKMFGNEFNSLKHNDFDKILNHEWLSKKLEESWSNGKDRMKVCSYNCGAKLSPSTDQRYIADRF